MNPKKIDALLEEIRAQEKLVGPSRSGLVIFGELITRIIGIKSTDRSKLAADAQIGEADLRELETGGLNLEQTVAVLVKICPYLKIKQRILISRLYRLISQ